MSHSDDQLLARFEERFATREELNARFEEARQHTDARFEEAKQHTDARFEESKRHTDTRFEELKRHTQVLYESTRDDIRQIAEGYVALSERMDRSELEMKTMMTEGFGRLELLIRAGFTRLDDHEQRILRLEERMAD